MSTPTYSCTMPEQRAKDVDDRLLVVTALFFVAAAVSTASVFLVLPYTILVVVVGTLALLSLCAAFVTFWVWKDVHTDAGHR